MIFTGANKVYIVKSGSGYLIKIENDTPEMTSDFVEAYRWQDQNFAMQAIAQLESLGFGAELVEVKIGNINNDLY